MNAQLKLRIIAAVKLARKNATPNVINVNDVIAASLFISNGTLDNSNVKEIQSYLNCNLSSYELACGYCQTFEHDGIKTTLYREHCSYHVVKYNHSNNSRIFWETFDTLHPARLLFKKQLPPHLRN
jgi:hypothetical protein